MNLFARFRKKPESQQYIYDGISLKNGRPTNMDSLGILEREIDGRHALLAVVCDGVGSLEKGGYAAAEATKGIIRWFSDLTSTERVQIRMREKLLELNRRILGDSASMGMETATTLSALLLVEQKYYIAHVGDSRIYLYRNGRMRQMTRDDVSETGALTSCIGYDDSPMIYCGQGQLEEDIFLLCSDGMYKRMDGEYLLSQMQIKNEKNIRTSIENLARHAAEMGEKDNITIAIVKISNGG